MTDQLPKFAENWIEEHELFGCIDAGLVRDFLAKFVLCERDSSAVMHEHTGELVLAQDAAYWGSNWIALHAPATEVPK
jgi:hypothetical protein